MSIVHELAGILAKIINTITFTILTKKIGNFDEKNITNYICAYVCHSGRISL